MAAAALALILLIVAPAMAQDWAVQPAASSLQFTGRVADSAFTGRFNNFTAQIYFDPAQPEQAKIRVTVALNTADAADPQRNQQLPTPAWFDSSSHPTAIWAARAVRKISDGHYRAEGSLLLKGITHDLPLDFQLTPQADGQMLATGSALLDRRHWQIGSGEWASDEWVDFMVQVQFRLLAAPIN